MCEILTCSLRLIVIVGLLFICTGCGDLHGVQKSSLNQPPLVRPLRRLLRNFIPTRTASITIVFQRSKMPRMRWFRQVSYSLPNAEIPNMISIDEDDPRYHFRYVSSHDITAATLSIRGLDGAFPMKFVVCFSIDSEPYQYQQDTVIDDITMSKDERLDGIIWVTRPRSAVEFDGDGQLSITCGARLESESVRFTDELNIYRSYMERQRKAGTAATAGAGRAGGVAGGGWVHGAQLMSTGCGKIHKDRDDYTEESGKYKYTGRRKVLSGGDAIFEVSFRVINGTHDDVGVYTCAVERARDRTYTSTFVRLARRVRPTIIMLPCDDTSTMASDKSGEPPPPPRMQTVELIEGRPTCIRCRAFDAVTTSGRPALISLRRGGDEMTPTRTLRLDNHLNVADGGLAELTVKFVRPSQSDAGVYRCDVAGEDSVENVEFKVVIRLAG